MNGGISRWSAELSRVEMSAQPGVSLQNDYYKYKEEAKRTGKLLKDYMKEERVGVLEYAEKVAFLYNSPEYLNYEIFEDFRPEIEACEMVLKDGGLSKDEKKMFEQQKLELQRQLVDAIESPNGYFKTKGIDVEGKKQERKEKINKNFKKNAKTIEKKKAMLVGN